MPKKGKVNNPSGKGGFSENPQNRNPGGWSKETSIPYLQNMFGRMDLNDFLSYQPKTVFEKTAYESVKKSWEELGYLKEVTDRTSGKPEQPIDHTTAGKELNQRPIIVFSDEEENNTE